ncbi:MAG: hypothetical protein Ct9H90mP16_04610 [Candidatus Poseidoniales archaeon]|nr:MAG: hypothetical protein Ct9H90mP16_04610 [Candidatus Poseidoniales archaeon]
MSSSHMKRLAMPRSWPLTRKTDIWISRPRPSGHPLERCMAMGVVLRDVIGVAKSMREAKRALATRKILVDGRVTTDIRRGVGVMDVLSVGMITIAVFWIRTANSVMHHFCQRSRSQTLPNRWQDHHQGWRDSAQPPRWAQHLGR